MEYFTIVTDLVELMFLTDMFVPQNEL